MAAYEIANMFEMSGRSGHHRNPLPSLPALYDSCWAGALGVWPLLRARRQPTGSPFQGVPPDVLLRIAAFLGPRDKLSLALTCRHLLWILYSGTVSVHLDPVPAEPVQVPPPQPWCDQGSLLHAPDSSKCKRRGFDGACIERLVVQPKTRFPLGATAVFGHIPVQLTQCLKVLHLQKCTLQAAALANFRNLSRLEMRDCTIYGNPAPWQRAYPVLGSGSRSLRSFALHNCVFDMGTGDRGTDIFLDLPRLEDAHICCTAARVHSGDEPLLDRLAFRWYRGVPKTLRTLVIDSLPAHHVTVSEAGEWAKYKAVQFASIVRCKGCGSLSDVRGTTYVPQSTSHLPVFPLIHASCHTLSRAQSQPEVCRHCPAHEASPLEATPPSPSASVLTSPPPKWLQPWCSRGAQQKRQLSGSAAQPALGPWQKAEAPPRDGPLQKVEIPRYTVTIAHRSPLDDEWVQASFERPIPGAAAPCTSSPNANQLVARCGRSHSLSQPNARAYGPRMGVLHGLCAWLGHSSNTAASRNAQGTSKVEGPKGRRRSAGTSGRKGGKSAKSSTPLPGIAGVHESGIVRKRNASRRREAEKKGEEGSRAVRRRGVVPGGKARSKGAS